MSHRIRCQVTLSVQPLPRNRIRCVLCLQLCLRNLLKLAHVGLRRQVNNPFEFSKSNNRERHGRAKEKTGLLWLIGPGSLELRFSVKCAWRIPAPVGATSSSDASGRVRIGREGRSHPQPVSQDALPTAGKDTAVSA
jgi:hypothetical protein